MKKGTKVEINPCMEVELVQHSLHREFRTPDTAPDTIVVKFELQVTSYECLSIVTTNEGDAFKLKEDGNRELILTNKLYPNLEAFIDYRAVNTGLEAEQTTQVYNNPYIVLKKIGTNSISIPLDTNLFGMREDALFYGFYIREENGSSFRVFDDEKLDSSFEVNKDGIAKLKEQVSLEERPIEQIDVDPSTLPVKNKSNTGIFVGGVILLMAANWPDASSIVSSGGVK